MLNHSTCLKEALDGFSYYLYAAGYSEQTITAYIANLSHIADYWENPPLKDITKEKITAFLAHKKRQGRSPETLRSYLKNLRAFLKWAEEEFGIQRPDQSIPSPPQQIESDVQPLDHDQIRALIKAAAFTRIAKTTKRRGFRMRRDTANRDIALILLLLDTGLRVSECARLTIGDINLKSGEVHINTFESGKKSQPRTVYLGRASRSALWRYLKIERGDPDMDAPVFTSRTGVAMNRNSIGKVLSNLGQAAGIAGVHPHRFRHTFALQYLRNGGDPFTLKRLLGHKTFRMVNYYLAIASADVQEAHRKSSPVDNWNL